MVILLLFAFIAGFSTILAPCIWPLLPIVLSSSFNGGKTGHARPLGVSMGVILSFSVVTLTISTLVMFFHFDPNILRMVAVVVITILGLSLIIPRLNRFIDLGILRLSQLWKINTPSNQNGFLPGFVTGLSLGIIWSPCAGPILASIATLSATGRVSFSVVLITISYAIGVGIPLFFVTYGGQQLISRLRFVNRYTGTIQKVFGVIMILTALLIYTNYDKVIQAKLLDFFPAYSQDLIRFENNPSVEKQLNVLKGNPTSATSQPVSNSDLFNTNYPAPTLTGITHWLNTDKPLTLKELRGKVVLVDFWTYTCINCIRTLPYITAWYNKYHADGFVVIGVHTPEFQFEHETANVQMAIGQFGIRYPVAQDNNYATWNAFNNEYWPAEYLIDSKGNVRRTHFGEGEYDQMEEAIQLLLKDAGKKISGGMVNLSDATPRTRLSPETYLGSKRAEYIYPDGTVQNGTRSFGDDQNAPANSAELNGTWTISPEEVVSGNNAAIVYHFYANKVFLVLRPPAGTVNCSNNVVDCGAGKITVLLDGFPITSNDSGSDVLKSKITVSQDRLYNIVNLHGKTGDHVLRLEFDTPGTRVYAFTFG